MNDITHLDGDLVARAGAPVPSQTDIVVVGAGIAGAAAAWELARRGERVVLLEKGAIAGEQSGRNLGFVRQQLRDPLELPLMMASITRWERLPEELEADIGWVQGGNLALARDESLLDAYRAWIDSSRPHGLASQLVDERQVRELLPGIAGEWAGGLYTPSDGQADPVKTTTAFARAAQLAGAHVAAGCTVTGIRVRDGKVTGVDTDRGGIAASTVVCAAGIWTSRLLATAEIVLPQRVMRSTLTRTGAVPRLTDAAVVSGDGTYFRQAPSGELLISDGKATIDVSPDTFKHLRMFLPMYLANRSRFQTHLGLEGFGPRVRKGMARYDLGEPAIDHTIVRQSLDSIGRLFPALRGLRAETAWSGRIEGTPDALPVLDALDDPKGLIVATGQSNHGFALGPVFGEVLADLVTRGDSEHDLTPFRLARFAEGAFGKPKSLIA